MEPLSNINNFINVSDCNTWYLYQFEDNHLTQEEKLFWGQNLGYPMFNSKSEGILNNVLDYPCHYIERSSPYFKELAQFDN